ncbi:MAG: type II toxin-antitoxin system RelE/ParE family toxin [Haliea sp.]|nr:type II toxin-antitoxin system RelE/ParE family toxin [Haliea sp.]
MRDLKRLPAAFYATPQGTEPVREWLKGLDEADRRIVGQDIATAEYGWPVGMPLSRSLGGRLFEIRSNITGGKISRVIFAVVGRKMVLLHGFVKRTQKTPKHDLDLAKRRLQEIQ